MVTKNSPLSDILSKEKEKLLACVHCGLCLEACPTYLATGNENDSPRGRIYLMRAVEEGRLKANSTAFESHINRCLGCRACEQVCPAGVEYGNLLEVSRAELRTKKEKRGITYLLQSWLLRYVWLYPNRLAILFFFARIFRDIKIPALLLKIGIPSLFPRMAFGLALLEASAPVSLTFTENEAVTDEIKSIAAEEKRTVMLFKGCVGEGLFSRVNQATERVLKANRRETQIPAKQACCGALHAHSGDLEGARVLAKRNIEAFADENGAPIITNAGGCGAMLGSYGHLLAGDAEYSALAESFSARVRDVSQELPNDSIPKNACQNPDSVTYDSSCHLLYGQKAAGDSLEMLLSAGVNYVPLPGSDVCCGGAGTYNLLEPELSSKILREKLDRLKQTGAKVLATGNPGCHMQIRAGMSLFEKSDLKVCHPVEILDEAYRSAGRYDKSGKE